MKVEISLDWLAFYLCVIFSIFAGYQGYSFIVVIIATLILLVVQVLTMPNCTYNKGKGLMQRQRFLTYSYNDLLGQYILDLGVSLLFFFVAKWVSNIKI